MAKSTSGHDVTTKWHILLLNLQHSYLLYDITESTPRGVNRCMANLMINNAEL